MHSYYAHDLGRGRAGTRNGNARGNASGEKRARGKRLDSIIERLIQDALFPATAGENCTSQLRASEDFNFVTR